MTRAAERDSDDGCAGPEHLRGLREISTIEVSSAALDPNQMGVATSPWASDYACTGLAVPPGPSSNTNGYLFRLCAVRVAANFFAILRGYRQLITIGQDIPLGVGGAGGTYPLQIEVESPLWRFRDGAASWHLRTLKGINQEDTSDPAQLPGTDVGLYGVDPSLLMQLGGSPPRYLAAGGGQPPGEPIGDLGTWRDNRGRWYSQGAMQGLHVLYEGPVDIAMYAWVKQTDPQTRPLLVLTPGQTFLRREDQFLGAYSNAIYGYVAGAMVLDVGPIQRRPQRERKMNHPFKLVRGQRGSASVGDAPLPPGTELLNPGDAPPPQALTGAT